MNYKKLIGVAAVTAGFAGLSTYTYQAVAASFTATSSVSTSVTFAETAGMNWGSLFARGSSTNKAAGLTLAPDGTYTTTTLSTTSCATCPSLFMLDDTNVSQGIFDVTGAAAFTTLKLSVSGSYATSGGTISRLSNAGAPPGSGNLLLKTFLLTRGDGTASGTNGNYRTLQTLGDGTLTVYVGASLQTQHPTTLGTALEYYDGTYSGSYNLEITY
ncbi:MAG: hypothetical protein HQL49_02395 [Gammaproteobacteria bacterium]|nr:hypothetical protein [Gammaproteobacteria bacterium]